MSYKVEVTAEEHESVLRGTLHDWSRMDPDVHLVSTEGHKIFSHKVLLSFYSSHLQQLLNEPVVMFSSQPATISVPASAATIAILLKMLVTGKSGTSQREILGEVREAARALGINMKNCFVDGKKSSSSGSGLTVIKLPVNSDTKINAVPARMPGPKPIPKPIKMIPKSLSSTKNIDTAGVSAWNTSLIKKNSGLRIELKEFVNEDTPAAESASIAIKKMKSDPAAESSSIAIKKMKSDKPTCDVCGTVFKADKYLYRHRYRQHGLKRKDRPSEEHFKIKQEIVEGKFKHPTCSQCSKVFDTDENLKKHIKKKHLIDTGDRRNKCDECPKSFNGRNELRTHKLTHLPDSEKPYKCEHCEKAFCQGGNLRTHLKNFHGVENPVIERVNSGSLNGSKLVDTSADETTDTTGEASDDTMQTDDEDPINLGNIINEEMSDTGNIILETEETTDNHDNCGYCGEKFDNEDDLNQHIVSMHS